MTTPHASAPSSPAGRHGTGDGELPEAGRALKKTEREGPTVQVPLLGEMTLPPPEHLVWYGAVAAMTALELIEWPVAIVVAVGKVLADNRHDATLKNVGDALENAG